MECREAQRCVQAFLKDELDRRTAEKFVEHVQDCDECMEELTIEYLLLEGISRLENADDIDVRSELEEKLHFRSDPRIKFVGAVYDKELLKKIRECAYGYFHGHEVGGTNPSLLEALGSTKLNLLLDVGFNREVGQDSALYWKKTNGSLINLIDKADNMDLSEINEYSQKAKERINNAFSWKFIGDEYKKVWINL